MQAPPGRLLTSHVGFVNGQNYRIVYSETMEAIEALLAGAPAGVLKPS